MFYLFYLVIYFIYFSFNIVDLRNKIKNGVFHLRLDGNEYIQDVVFQIL